MQTAVIHHSQPGVPSGPNPIVRDKQAAADDAASREAKRSAYLLQLRNELLADMSDSDDDQPTTSFRNPFTTKKAEAQPQIPAPQPIAKTKCLQVVLATRHDVQQAGDLEDEEPDGLLSEAELVLLGRVRRLVEASAPKPKKNTIVRPEIVPPEEPASLFPSRGTETRDAGGEKGSDADPKTKPPIPYDKERRKRRRLCEPQTANKGDPAAVQDHEGEDCEDDTSCIEARACQTGDQEAPAHKSTDQEGAQRTSHNGLQVRSQVVPKRHVRCIPGRYSALDSDEEEEWFRRRGKEQAMRKAQQEAQGANGSPGQQLGYPGYNGVPNYRLPPQIYPTLQYGRRPRLYHPKLDEVMAWTSSADHKPLVLDTWRCRTCDHRTNVLSAKCDRCNGPKPGPLVLNTTPVGQLLAEEKSREQQKRLEQQLNLHQQQIQEMKAEIEQLKGALRMLQL
ncbi:hypothetical protein EC968_002051 [Mortierella alpina]|nr:hypothetical protein EC968_002051 [Mortierella alpina]